MASLPVQFSDVLQAASRLKNYVHRTPMLTSSILDKRAGRKLFFKAENLQKTGSFKVRGALNAVMALKESDKALKGVVTQSSGNHGQGLAYAATQSNVPCIVVTPEYCVQGKQDAMRNYGATLSMCPSTVEGRVKGVEKVQGETGYTYVSPSENRFVMAGQGTIAMEMLEEVPDLDAILVSIAGGGLSGGIAVAAKQINPNIKVFCVEPAGKDLEPSLRKGERLWEGPPRLVDTIADAIRLQEVWPDCFKILAELAEKTVFSATDEDIIEAMKLVFHHMKIVIEAAAGASVAAALSSKMAAMPSDMQKVGVVLCGGNVDIEKLPWMGE